MLYMKPPELITERASDSAPILFLTLPRCAPDSTASCHPQTCPRHSKSISRVHSLVTYFLLVPFSYKTHLTMCMMLSGLSLLQWLMKPHLLAVLRGASKCLNLCTISLVCCRDKHQQSSAHPPASCHICFRMLEKVIAANKGIQRARDMVQWERGCLPVMLPIRAPCPKHIQE